MYDELAKLRREVRALKLYAITLTGAAVMAGLVAFRSTAPEDQILRARGLVIVDAAGRERILLGAPIPESRSRVRTDTARVRSIWGPRFSPKYMEWYARYRHSMNGMLVLDERGFDRVAVGDSVPDPNIGKRVGPSTGLIINDGQGFERSGYGLISVDGQDRMVLGLDDSRGEEGLALAVFDSGRAGLMVHDGKHGAYLGSAPANDPVLKTSSPFIGLVLRQGETERRITPNGQ
jgi:hypothetical protein